MFRTGDTEVGLGNVRIGKKIPLDERVGKVGNIENGTTTTTTTTKENRVKAEAELEAEAEVEVEVGTRKKIEKEKVRMVERTKKNTRTRGRDILGLI